MGVDLWRVRVIASFEFVHAELRVKLSFVLLDVLPLLLDDYLRRVHETDLTLGLLFGLLASLGILS
jgi:hypothetical protein